MKTGLRRFVLGSALIGMLAGASVGGDENRPVINSVPVFGKGVFFESGKRVVTNYVELKVTASYNGAYHLEMSKDLSDTNGWACFGKTNVVNVSSNGITTIQEYTPADLNNLSQAYFRVAGLANDGTTNLNTSASTK